MTGRGRTLVCSTMKLLSGVCRRIQQPVPAARHRSFPALPALFCLGIFIIFFLITPAIAEGFVESDCTCSLSGVSVKSRSAGSEKLECTWTKSSTSSGTPPGLIAAVKTAPDKATLVAALRESNAVNQQSANEQKSKGGFSCIEEYFSDTRSSMICGEPAEKESYLGGRSFIYRDTYGIAIGGGGFTSGQEMKSYFDQLEPCMKRAADVHASRQSGTSIPAAITTIKKPTTTVKPGITTTRPGTASEPNTGNEMEDLMQDFEEDFQQYLAEMGEEINGILPYPVDWDEVPEAMSDSVTPATLGALGALLGGTIGALSLFPPGFTWPGNEGGEGEGGDDESGGDDDEGGDDEGDSETGDASEHLEEYIEIYEGGPSENPDICFDT